MNMSILLFCIPRQAEIQEAAENDCNRHEDGIFKNCIDQMALLSDPRKLEGEYFS
jgi:hypothetical protein